MEKKWVTMHAFCGYQIQILNGAEDGDRMDYRILPALREGEIYPTIQAAIDAIKHEKETEGNEEQMEREQREE